MYILTLFVVCSKPTTRYPAAPSFFRSDRPVIATPPDCFRRRAIPCRLADAVDRAYQQIGLPRQHISCTKHRADIVSTTMFGKMRTKSAFSDMPEQNYFKLENHRRWATVRATPRASAASSVLFYLWSRLTAISLHLVFSARPYPVTACLTWA